MIDCHRLCAKCGDGGNGCFSFNRYRHMSHRKAYGRHGESGGDVILLGFEQLATSHCLLYFPSLLYFL
ncbi:putative GTP1/OBG domain-containing protein [Helianthus debilis subsp. tardiflorus]